MIGTSSTGEATALPPTRTRSAPANETLHSVDGLAVRVHDTLHAVRSLGNERRRTSPPRKTRTAYDEFGLVHDALVHVVELVLCLSQEQLGRGPTDTFGRLPHRSQWHRRLLGELDVVIADDRHLLGHPYPGGEGAPTVGRLSSEGACVVIADRDTEAANEVAAELGGPDRAVAVPADVTDERDRGCLSCRGLAFGGVDLVVNNAGLSLSKPLLDTTVEDWDRQHEVMARGSFLVSREAARTMIDQGRGGDIVYISSKNAVFAGVNNVAYGATKADQAHQVRLLAAELGEHGIRVNGINPDGAVRGSGIFAGGWGAQRAALYGVEEGELGRFYAQRTILKREVLPEHVANAVFVLVGGDLTHTTGVHIPVDAGVAAAFLR